MDSADLARLNPSLKTDWIPYYQMGFLNVPSDKSQILHWSKISFDATPYFLFYA